MKTIEHVKKTKWNINKRLFFTKKFQGFVFSIDFDVPQGFSKTVCVFTFKFIFIGMWISFDNKTIVITRLSKYKSGGLLPKSSINGDSILKSYWEEKGRDLPNRSIAER